MRPKLKPLARYGAVRLIVVPDEPYHDGEYRLSYRSGVESLTQTREGLKNSLNSLIAHFPPRKGGALIRYRYRVAIEETARALRRS